MHHRDIGDTIKGMQPPVCLLALNWSLDLPLAEIHQICTDRMLARAANHQTLHGDENSKRTRASYEMNVREDLEQALSPAVDAVGHATISPSARPAEAFRTSTCFGILAKIDLIDVLDTHIAARSENDPVRKFRHALKARSGVARRPHIMIMRSKQLPDPIYLWECFAVLYALPALPPFSTRLGHVVAHGRIMAVMVEDLHVDDS
ncbi:hypothetical protein V8E53_007150 [Lactarius tabidus]